MRSSDQTLLASLGFSDPDKKEPRHDWACQYLAQADVFARVLKIALGENYVLKQQHHAFEQMVSKGHDQYRQVIGWLDLWARADGKMLYPGGTWVETNKQIQGGSSLIQHPDTGEWGYYRKEWRFQSEEETVEWVKAEVPGGGTFRPGRHYWEKLVYEDPIYHHVLMEVKIHPVSLGDVLRQLKLYREFEPVDLMFLATAYGLPAEDVRALRAEKIVHVRLGANFEEYCRSRQLSTVDHSDSPEV